MARFPCAKFRASSALQAETHTRILPLPQDWHTSSNNHRTVQRCPSALRSSTSEGHRDVEPYIPSTASSPACCFGCSPRDLCCRATGLQVYLSYAHLLVVGDVTIQTKEVQGGGEIVIGLLSYKKVATEAATLNRL